MPIILHTTRTVLVLNEAPASTWNFYLFFFFFKKTKTKETSKRKTRHSTATLINYRIPPPSQLTQGPEPPPPSSVPIGAYACFPESKSIKRRTLIHSCRPASARAIKRRRKGGGGSREGDSQNQQGLVRRRGKKKKKHSSAGRDCTDGPPEDRDSRSMERKKSSLRLCTLSSFMGRFLKE